ncbi:MAG: DUF1127 domain-containing protein, partial [Pseudolabrys sp.]
MEDLSDPNLRLSSYDFARQMNIQRTMLMRAYLRGVGSAIAAGVRSFARVCVRFAKQAVAWQRLQRDIHALQKLDDRMLSDIGVSRDEFEWIVRNGRPVREMPHFAPYPRRKLGPAVIERKPGPKTVPIKSHKSAWSAAEKASYEFGVGSISTSP